MSFFFFPPLSSPSLFISPSLPLSVPYFLFIYFAELRALCVLSTCSTIELCPSPKALSYHFSLPSGSRVLSFGYQKKEK